jgi:nicotinate phosphoribosyltransferase
MTEMKRTGPLFIDLYELTMAAAYHDRQIRLEAAFSLFIRPSPKRGYYVAAGLEDTLNELEQFQFNDEEIDFIQSTRLFSDGFVAYLRTFRFSGQVVAMPEGTIFFANEPILEVRAPVIEAQLLETFLLNTMGFQTLIASKAARCVHAAQGRPLIDFSLRRTQGRDAGMRVARSTYIAGFAATSNVLAGKTFQIPTAGTMAHSFITAFEEEIDAFSAYAETFPDHSIFLIDTYDTLKGARHAVQVAQQMKQKGHALVGVRLDSGDMASLSRQVRKILDDAGLTDVKIFASSQFDEYKIAAILAKEAPIDAFGVGTKVGVSADAPFVDIVYKMVRYGDHDVKKLSPGKTTLAGEKQVFRIRDENGRYREDIIGLRNDRVEDAETLLQPVMEHGKVLRPHPSLQELRQKFKENFSALDQKYKALKDPPAYPVRLSPRLQQRQESS